MRRKDTGVALAAVFAIAAGAGFASGGGKNTQKATPNTEALKRGCRTGGTMDVNTTNPSWVSVDPSDKARPLEGVVRVSKVTWEDYPANHESHDWNIFIKPDTQYEFMNSDANHFMDADGKDVPKGDPNGAFCMEAEWETKQFDMRFWPVVGDRATVLGRWIFDCGHPPYRSEIHPPKFTAFTRMSPHTFTGDTTPSYTNKAFVFINGQGGYFYDRIGGAKYTFDIHVPPKPGTSRGLLDRLKGRIRPARPGQPAEQPEATPDPAAPPVTPVAAAAPPELRAQVLETPFGGPTPTLTPLPDQNKVRVTYDLSRVVDPQRWNLYQHPLSARPKNTPKFGAVIAAGWREPVVTQGYRVVKVTFDNIKVNTDHDVIPFSSGEWRFWVHVNGTWMQIPGLGDVDGGKTYNINKSVLVTVPEDGELALQTTGWESDEIDEHFRMDNPGALPFTPSSRGFLSGLKKVAKKVGSGVKKAAKATGGAVKDAAGAVKDAGKAVGGAVKDAAVATGGAVKDAAVAVKDKVVNEIKEGLNNEPIGTVSARYSAGQNFGIRSAVYDARSTSGDFHLRYRIEEVQRIAPGTANGARALNPSRAKTITRK